MFLTLVGSSCSVAKGKLGSVDEERTPKAIHLSCLCVFFLTAETFEIQRFIATISKEKARSPWKVNALLDI